jgi:hypothetical protein
MLGSVYGYTRCPDCGLSVPTVQIQGGTHVCSPENLVAHQTLKARQELDHLEEEVGDYLGTERCQKLLAFARWRLAHGR